MKAILEYNMDNPDDQLAHLRAVHSINMAIAIFEIQNNLKRKLEEIYNINHNTLDLVFEEINNIFESNNINIDKLID